MTHGAGRVVVTHGAGRVVVRHVALGERGWGADSGHRESGRGTHDTGRAEWGTDSWHWESGGSIDSTGRVVVRHTALGEWRGGGVTHDIGRIWESDTWHWGSG